MCVLRFVNSQSGSTETLTQNLQTACGKDGLKIDFSEPKLI